MGLSPSHAKRDFIHSRASAFSGVSVRRPRKPSPARNSRSARIFAAVMFVAPGALRDWAAAMAAARNMRLAARTVDRRIIHINPRARRWLVIHGPFTPCPTHNDAE